MAKDPEWVREMVFCDSKLASEVAAQIYIRLMAEDGLRTHDGRPVIYPSFNQARAAGAMKYAYDCARAFMLSNHGVVPAPEQKA